MAQKGFLDPAVASDLEQSLRGRESEMSPSQTGEAITCPPLTGRQVEQRIEEDRERGKRLREGAWATAATDEDDLATEGWKLFDEVSSLGEDDHILGEEEWAEFERCVAEQREEECALRGHSWEEGRRWEPEKKQTNGNKGGAPGESSERGGERSKR